MADRTLTVTAPLTLSEATPGETALGVNLSTYAPLASPALTGTPTAPTPAASDNSTKLATTAYVDAAVGGAAAAMAIITDSTTARTFLLTDANDYVEFTNAGAITATVPPNSSVAFPVGTTIHIEQAAAGAVTITAGSGVTINKHADFTLVTDGQYAVASITKKATDTWTAYGKLVPV